MSDYRNGGRQQYSNRMPQSLGVFDMKIIHASKPTTQGGAMQFGGGLRIERYESTQKPRGEQRTKDDYAMIWTNVIVLGDDLMQWLQDNPLEQHDWVRVIGEMKFFEGLNAKENVIEPRLTIFVRQNPTILTESGITLPVIQVLEYGTINQQRGRRDLAASPLSQAPQRSATRRAAESASRSSTPQPRPAPGRPRPQEAATDLGGWDDDD